MSFGLAIPDAIAHRSSTYGTRAQMAAGDGQVEGYLALAGCDKRAGTASYALRIVNQSPHPLRARMTCARLRGEAVLAYPLDVQVAPFAISETLLPVRVADVGPYDRAIVQVCGRDVAFSLEAPAPAKTKSRPRWIAAGAAAAAVTLACAFGAAASTPRIGLLAAPRALSGNALDVPYQFGGWASMEYALQTRDGRQIAAGLAQEHQGTLHFAIPKNAGNNVVLAVAAGGPFGKTSATREIAIAPKPVMHPVAPAASKLQIAAFAVASPDVRAGAAVKLTYITNASAGEIWLIDDTGRLLDSKPVYAEGATWMHVPVAAAGREVRAVLHARSGAQTAVSTISFIALPGAVEASTNPQTAPAHAAIALSSDRVSPGDTVTVTLQGPHGDARVTLSDKSGNTVAQGDVPASQNAVTLTAPEVSGPTTYYVIANVTQGRGEDTVVKKLLIAPR